MKIIKMIEQIKTNNDYDLNDPIYMGVLPNDGHIIDGYPQAILTFDDDHFIIFTFKGMIRHTYDKFYKFSFEDITEMQIGKYNFKDRFIKINFGEENYIAFQYFLKVKGHQDQQQNLEKFIKKLESIATIIE